MDLESLFLISINPKLLLNKPIDYFKFYVERCIEKKININLDDLILENCPFDHFKFLIEECNINLNTIDIINGQSALFIQEDPEKVKLLLRSGIDTSIKDINGNTAINVLKKSKDLYSLNEKYSSNCDNIDLCLKLISTSNSR